MNVNGRFYQQQDSEFNIIEFHNYKVDVNNKHFCNYSYRDDSIGFVCRFDQNRSQQLSPLTSLCRPTMLSVYTFS